MYLLECIDKVYKNNSNIVAAYKLIDVYTGKILNFTKDALKLAMKSKSCACINLQLTSDNRLIDKKKDSSNSNIWGYYVYLNKCRVLGVKPHISCVVDQENDRVALEGVEQKKGETFVIPSYITDILVGYKGQDKSKVCYGPFAHCVETEYVKVLNHSKQIKSIHGLFAGLRAKVVDLSEMETYNITDMSSLFEYADISEIRFGGKFKTSKVTNMSRMFFEISALTLDISKLNTSRVENMSEMFADCLSLEQLNIKGIKTGNVKTFFRMFANCIRLKKLDLSSFDTSGASNTMMMFDNTRSLNRLDTSNFDMSNVKTAYAMFKNTTNIKEIILPYCGIGNYTVTDGLVSNSSVRSIDFGGITPEFILRNGSNIVSDCKNLNCIKIHGRDLWNRREFLVKCIHSITSWLNNSEMKLVICKQYTNENELINYIIDNVTKISKVEISK